MLDLSTNKDRFKISAGLVFLEIGLLIIITAHFVLLGAIPYIDLLGYLLLITGLNLSGIIINRFTLMVKLALTSFALSLLTSTFLLISTVILSKELSIIQNYLNTGVSLVVFTIDIIITYILCKDFLLIGLHFNNIEVCDKSSGTIKSLMALVIVILANNLQWVFGFGGALLSFLSNGLIKIFLLACILYVYMEFLGLLKASKRLLRIYDVI